MSTHELSPSDREQITRLISHKRPGRMSEIISLEAEGPDIVAVRTGISRSANSGIGYIFRATKRDGQWLVEEVEMWQA